MHRHLTLAVTVAGLLSFTGTAPAEDQLPKAEGIMDKFIEATGGQAAYEKLDNEMWTGTFEFAGKGIKGTATSYRAKPNRSFTTIELEGVGTIEDGTDGETAWTRSALQGPRVKQGDERAAVMREATFNSPIHWRDLYKHAETAGAETVDSQECYKVVLTPNEGKPETRYFDKKTNLLVKVAMTLESPMGELPVETIVGDYKEQNGLLSPRKVRQKVLGQEFLVTIDTVKYNVEIPKNRFDLPEDIKTLVAKPAPAAK
jgi:hypothetical protein